MLLRQEVKEILIDYGKPHKPVTSDTDSRWIKDELTLHESRLAYIKHVVADLHLRTRQEMLGYLYETY